MLVDPNQHKDGITWWDAPIPPKRHKCWVQSEGYVQGTLFQRCACGAIQMDGDGYWMEVNQRSPKRKSWWRK